MTTTTPPARRAAVLGQPVAHSLSPLLHRAAYAALGLEGWDYDAIEVAPDGLEAVIDGLDRSWAGLSLTMPHKQTVIPMLDHVEPLAEVVGAVNTVLVQGGGARPVLTGANTDVHGIVAAVREAGNRQGSPDHQPAARTFSRGVVLGAGATAASTLAALAQLGCSDPVVLVRSLSRVGPLMRAAHRMGVEPTYALLAEAPDHLRAADLVVSTLPAHGADPVAEAVALAGVDRRHDGARPVLLDVVYDPRPTALMTTLAGAGFVVVGGERMLLHQAAEQVRLMTAREAPLAAMDAALRQRLDG